MLRFLVVIAVMVLLPFSASAQQSGPAPAEPPAAAIAPPSAFATAAQIEASKNEILRACRGEIRGPTGRDGHGSRQL